MFSTEIQCCRQLKPFCLSSKLCVCCPPCVASSGQVCGLLKTLFHRSKVSLLFALWQLQSENLLRFPWGESRTPSEEEDSSSWGCSACSSRPTLSTGRGLSKAKKGGRGVPNGEDDITSTHRHNLPTAWYTTLTLDIILSQSKHCQQNFNFYIYFCQKDLRYMCFTRFIISQFRINHNGNRVESGTKVYLPVIAFSAILNAAWLSSLQRKEIIKKLHRISEEKHTCHYSPSRPRTGNHSGRCSTRPWSPAGPVPSPPRPGCWCPPRKLTPCYPPRCWCEVRSPGSWTVEGRQKERCPTVMGKPSHCDVASAKLFT